MLNLLYTPTWCFWQKQFVRIEIVYLVLVFKRKSTLLGFYQSNIIYKVNTKQEAMTNIMAVFTYVDKDIWLQSG